MIDTIFIHAGLPKTGSTFIQNGMAFLAANGMLERVHYPVTDSNANIDTIGSGNGMELSGLILNPASESALRGPLDALVESLLANRPRGVPDLLISSEIFFFATTDGFECLRKSLARHARTIKLVLSVRPLRDWTYSVYLQRVKAHGLAAPYDAAWLSGYCASFEEKFRNLDRFNLETIILPYRKSGQFAAFLEAIGENPALAELVPIRSLNRSLTDDELDVLRLVNRLFNDSKLSEKISEEFVRTWPELKGSIFPTSAQESFESFNASFSKKLQALRGPVISRVRVILDSSNEASVPAEQRAPSDRLPEIFGIVLKALSKSFESYLKDADAYSRLRERVNGLDRSTLFFDPIHYLLLNPDVLFAGAEPWTHFLEHGKRELRESALVRKGVS